MWTVQHPLQSKELLSTLNIATSKCFQLETAIHLSLLSARKDFFHAAWNASADKR